MSGETKKMISGDDAKNVAGGAIAPPASDGHDSLHSALPSSELSEVANGRKVVIKSADMKPQLQKEAIDVAISAFEKSNVEKDIAEDIKKQFDKKYGPTWHCIVGKSFGSYVTHETNHFIYFYMDSKAILLFKSGLLVAADHSTFSDPPMPAS